MKAERLVKNNGQVIKGNVFGSVQVPSFCAVFGLSEVVSAQRENVVDVGDQRQIAAPTSKSSMLWSRDPLHPIQHQIAQAVTVDQIIGYVLGMCQTITN